MQLRTATAADLPHLAALAAPLQARPERHIAYLGIDAPGIEAELAQLSWQLVSVVATDRAASGITGFLIGDVDEEMGRVWWHGPFVDDDDWQSLADELLADARRQLPPNVTEEEMAIDARFTGFETWAADHGFAVEVGSWVLRLERDLVAPTSDENEYRSMTDADHDDVARIHEEQFPGTHTTGARLVAKHDAEHPRLVAVADDTVVGYVAVEKEPDGSGYIDFVAVEPSHRRRGIGAGLIGAGVVALEGLGAEPVCLTVREDIAGARELYASLGFTEERLISPLRRGFRAQ